MCAGGALPKTADEIWQQVGTKAPGLLHRMASVGAGYDVTRESIAALAKPLSDGVSYTRPGASGALRVTKDRGQLNARRGLLRGVFKGKIESAIVDNLDQLLAHKDPLHAFEQGLARHETRHEGKPDNPPKHAKPAEHVETKHKAAPRKAK